MIDQIENVLNRLRTSLWLVPAIISMAGAGLAYLVLFSGITLAVDTADHWWLFSGDAGTARDLLSSLLSGMITMTSLVVSITMVVLSLAAGQLGPRLIGNFIRDREIQAVLGLFMGTILYTLFVLRSVTDALGADFVPHIAITIASGLVVLCLFALLFYVHKIARSIIADTVVAKVADELEQAIRHARTAGSREGDPGQEKARYDMRGWVSLGKAGYVQVVDYGRLASLASRLDILLEIDVRAGHFILRGGDHVDIRSNRAMDDSIAAEIRAAFVIGDERTQTQDLEFSVRQLVEIAVRALSPGINDPFTALAVINRLGAALESASCRGDPPRIYRDDDGRIRVIAVASDFGGLVDTAFDQIRQAGATIPAVLIQMAEVIGQLALVVGETERRAALLGHVGKLDRAARNLGDPKDLEDYLAVSQRTRSRLLAPPSGIIRLDPVLS